jgi:hypothetical protein
VTIVLTRPRMTGRHRLGQPGLVPVTAMMKVLRRGFFSSWLRPGRHRGSAAPGTSRKAARAHVPAAA